MFLKGGRLGPPLPAMVSMEWGTRDIDGGWRIPMGSAGYEWGQGIRMEWGI